MRRAVRNLYHCIRAMPPKLRALQGAGGTARDTTSLPGIHWFLAKTSHNPQGRQDKLETKHTEGVRGIGRRRKH